MRFKPILAIAFIASLALGGSLAAAYQVLPRVSDVDRKLGKLNSDAWTERVFQWGVRRVVPLLKAPIHESITLASLGCDVEPSREAACLTPQNVAQHRIILYGVRWPDDPPFRLDPSDPPEVGDCDVRITVRSTAQPKCWKALFDDAARRASMNKGTHAAFGPGTAILYRSHFGDLQFMHSMAAYDGEVAAVTRERIALWAEFLWGIAVGTLRADVFLRDLGMPQIAELFPGDMTATNLLATGIVEPRRHLDQVAIGVLLHMVQDSFSRAHTERAEANGGYCVGTDLLAPGRIRRFHGYARQDSSLHDVEDTGQSLAVHMLEQSPSVVDASKALIQYWNQRSSWQDVKPYFECVFAIADADAPAGPGPYRTP